MGNFYLLVVDGLGVGAQEDAADYGDTDANTLRHVCETDWLPSAQFPKDGAGQHH
ncbi:MAG: hypothetical protein U5K69_08860 [Balneolaceae bacterium]|nr:hypothetical protein [Balneolaceae bacterium]